MLSLPCGWSQVASTDQKCCLQNRTLWLLTIFFLESVAGASPAERPFLMSEVEVWKGPHAAELSLAVSLSHVKVWAVGIVGNFRGQKLA
jgi:hypothetical protein